MNAAYTEGSLRLALYLLTLLVGFGGPDKVALRQPIDLMGPDHQPYLSQAR